MADPSSTSPQQGYNLGQMESTRSMAMGGSMAAVGTSTTALYENPANLPFARVYHFETFTTYVPEARRQSYGGAIADSSTNRLNGGFAGSYNLMDPDGINRTWVDLRLSLAYSIADWLAVGIAGRYMNIRQSVSRGPFGSSFVSDGTPDGALWSGFTADAGVTIQPFTGLRIGSVAKNLTHPGNGLLPTVIASGVGYTTDVFALEADALVDFDTWGHARPRFSGGGEVFLASRVPLRVGYRYDLGTRAHTLSTGLGYVDKRFGVELSGRRDISADHPATVLSLAVRYFYDAASTPDTIGTME